MYDMVVRKKALKIQERLGMRIGIAYGTSSMPVVKTVSETLDVLQEIYKVGLKAFVLPPELFARIGSASDIFKQHYDDLLKIKETASKLNIELSLRHDRLGDMPDNELMIFASISSIMGCRSFAINPSFYSNMPSDQALKLAVYKINEVVSNLRSGAKIGIQTTGKISEVGSLGDVIEIVKRTHSTEPIINWGHIHARGSGSLRSQDDFRRILDTIRAEIGQGWLNNVFFYFGGVSYGPSGVIRQIPIRESDMNLEYMIKESMALGINGTLILEDPGKERFVLNTLEKLADMVR